jgi:hypothetical protein
LIPDHSAKAAALIELRSYSLNRSTDSLGHPAKQFTEPFAQPHILEVASVHLLINPGADGRGLGCKRSLRGAVLGLYSKLSPQLSLFVHFIR